MSASERLSRGSDSVRIESHVLHLFQRSLLYLILKCSMSPNENNCRVLM